MKLYLVIQDVDGKDVITWGSQDQLRLEMSTWLEYFFKNAQLGDWLLFGDNDVIIRVGREEMVDRG